VEQYCSSNDIEYEWIGADRLRTRQVRKAIQTHPITKESVWFNHAVFFHVSTLDPTTRQVLQANLPEEDLPNNTYYGDGSLIESETLDHLRTIYREEMVCFPWIQGDILMLDNMLIAHGRAPYLGARKILVGMSDPYSA
jgi:alpha-ketoglutarate-dependent taurine dioxygenase